MPKPKVSGARKRKKINLLDLPNLPLSIILDNLPVCQMIRDVSPLCFRLRDIALEVLKNKRSLHLMSHMGPLPSQLYFNMRDEFDVCIATSSWTREDSLPTDMPLYTEEHVQKFVQVFPNLTSLSISTKCGDGTPAIRSLIESYPSLTRLEYAGVQDLTDTLGKLPNLKHFTHYDYAKGNYIWQVPEAFKRLETLALNFWEDPELLPKQLKEIRFVGYPEEMKQNPEYYLKIASLREEITRTTTNDELLAMLQRITKYERLEHLQMIFYDGFKEPTFFKKFLNSIQRLQNLERIHLACGMPPEDMTGIEEVPTAHGYYYIRPNNDERRKEIEDMVREHSPMRSVKSLKIQNIPLPFILDQIHTLFPNVAIDFVDFWGRR